MRYKTNALFGIIIITSFIFFAYLGNDNKSNGQELPTAVTNIVSFVPNVKVTGINASGDKEISLDLSYLGKNVSPPVTLIVTAVNITPEEVREFLTVLSNLTNVESNKIGPEPSSPLLPTSKTLIGSTDFDSGWNSSTIKLKLEGNTTLKESNNTSIQIFPHFIAMIENEGEEDRDIE